MSPTYTHRLNTVNGIKYIQKTRTELLPAIGVYCAEIGEVENAEPVALTGVFGDKNVLGTQASFMCKANYLLVEDAIRTCQQDGTWSGTQPRCIGKEG